MSAEHSQPAHAAVKGPGYEVRDANLKALLQFAFWLAVLIAVTLVTMRITFSYLSRLTPLGPASSPFESAHEVPSGPLLQVHPHDELNTYCSAQRDAVNRYAWLNQAGGIVQIPIDQAMAVTLQKGLPARSADEMAAAGATIPPVGAAGEPDATYLQGPCGYLSEPAAAAAVPND